MALRALVASLALFAGTLLAASVEFHVAPSGDDGAAGTRAGPFRTLTRARDAVRALRRAGPLPPGGVTVWIHGMLRLEAPLELVRGDSGVAGAPIVYRGAVEGPATLSGARRVGGFRPVTDPAVLERLPEVARRAVRVADLRASGIADLGTAATRGKRLEVFVDDRPLRLARWPNDGFTRIKDIATTGRFKSHGIEGTHEGNFFYQGDRPARWVREPEVWLHGYWFWDWSDSFQRVASIDPATRRILLAPPPHHYGYRKGQRYYALNLLSEIDTPGEWYLDRATRRLYLWPPSSAGGNAAGTTTVTVLPHIAVLRECSRVTFQDLRLEGTRSAVVTIEGGEEVLISRCTIRNGGGWGVVVKGGHDHTVRSCDLADLGEGGIALEGGDRATLSPAGHRAVNNHIRRFGRLYRTYRPAISLRGVGIRVAHNLIHDGPHNAIQLGGNDHVIEYNEIHHVCYETGDVGAFYMGRNWTERGTIIRYNFFHDIKGPGLYGAMAVYLDDAASGITVRGNLFCRAGRAAFIGGGRDNLIENNVFVDCDPSVHVDARGAGWMRSTVEDVLPQRLRAMPYRSDLWRARYPRLASVLEDAPGLPKGNVVRRNISVGGRWTEIEAAARPYVRFEANLVARDPRFAGDPRAPGATPLSYRLRPDSPALELGFKPIPLERIGLETGIGRPRPSGAR